MSGVSAKDEGILLKKCSLVEGNAAFQILNESNPSLVSMRVLKELRSNGRFVSLSCGEVAVANISISRCPRI